MCPTNEWRATLAQPVAVAFAWCNRQQQPVQQEQLLQLEPEPSQQLGPQAQQPGHPPGPQAQQPEHPPWQRGLRCPQGPGTVLRPPVPLGQTPGPREYPPRPPRQGQKQGQGHPHGPQQEHRNQRRL